MDVVYFPSVTPGVEAHVRETVPTFSRTILREARSYRAPKEDSLPVAPKQLQKPTEIAPLPEGPLPLYHRNFIDLQSNRIGMAIALEDIPADAIRVCPYDNFRTLSFDFYPGKDGTTFVRTCAFFNREAGLESYVRKILNTQYKRTGCPYPGGMTTQLQRCKTYDWKIADVRFHINLQEGKVQICSTYDGLEDMLCRVGADCTAQLQRAVKFQPEKKWIAQTTDDFNLFIARSIYTLGIPLEEVMQDLP
ncbi:hypothetical protein HY490_04870 [Candidatus Woesearchaeota archaeon]|nr:hypothetical protein [Candidatus Woesearchaeota archaeon]